MHFEKLSYRESDLVREVLRAAANGPFFPDWEFQTLFGLKRDQVRRIAEEWPSNNASPEEVVLAVNNSFNWLLNYPHGKRDRWMDWISVDRDVLNELFNRLRGMPNESPFERMM